MAKGHPEKDPADEGSGASAGLVIVTEHGECPLRLNSGVRDTLSPFSLTICSHRSILFEALNFAASKCPQYSVPEVSI